ncbi:adenosine kinase-like [Varroa destructor]|uniref:Adenosine kinase n=1 Tax=Varroa destructor TaxID=109461 RepID=A0A7M7JVR6_VARDE|nr:adenosine kinase-like [Varroa destructor]
MPAIPKGALFCMGNPLLDMSAEVDQTFLDKYKLEGRTSLGQFSEFDEDNHKAPFKENLSVDSMVMVGQHATSERKVFCMNLSAPFLCKLFQEQMMRVMPYVDILFGNEVEAVELARSQKWPDQLTVKEIAKRAAALPKEQGSRIVVFTQGSKPVIVMHKDGSITEHPVEDIPKSKIVDTNGAGDAFVGGFLAGHIEGKSIKDCVSRGIAAASVMIQQSGCSLPKRSTFKDPCAL